MQKRFYVRDGDAVRGPWTLQQIRLAVSNGLLSPTALVSRSQSGPWSPLKAAVRKGKQSPGPPPLPDSRRAQQWPLIMAAASGLVVVSVAATLLIARYFWGADEGNPVAGSPPAKMVASSSSPAADTSSDAPPVAKPNGANSTSPPGDPVPPDDRAPSKAPARPARKPAETPGAAPVQKQPPAVVNGRGNDNESTGSPLSIPAGAKAAPPAELPKPKPLLPPIPPEKTAASVALISRMHNDVSRERTAADALALYERFVQSYTFTPDQQEKVDAELTAWRERAEEGLVRLGTRWVEAEEVEQARKAAQGLMGRAFAVLELGNFSEAIHFFEEASTADPNGISAGFQLGLLYSSPGARLHDPSKGEEHFQEVLRRFPDHVCALNNVGVCEIKQRKFSSAYVHLKRCAELAPQCPEVTQNLGRLLTLAAQDRIRLSATEERKFSTLYSELIASKKGLPAEEGIGWLYMPPILPREEEQPDQEGKANAALLLKSFGTGFVVAPQFVLTNRHVIFDEDYERQADAVRFVDPADPARQRQLQGTVVAICDTADLALVRFPQLQAAPIPLSDKPARLASNILILGYPLPDLVGSDLKSTAGIVAGVQPDDVYFDAVANPGNSGGPILNELGKVVAVLALGIFVGHEDKMPYTGGVPLDDVKQFLRENGVNLPPGNKRQKPASWEEIVAGVEHSVFKLDVYYKAGAPELVAALARESRRANWLEDDTCPLCNGLARLRCPNRRCRDGAVTEHYVKKTPIRTSLGNVVVVHEDVFNKVPCKTCDGRGIVDCPGCRDGFDPQLLR